VGDVDEALPPPLLPPLPGDSLSALSLLNGVAAVKGAVEVVMVVALLAKRVV